jgi:streptogramin lyase
MGAAARRSASPRATKRVGERGEAEIGQMAAFDAPRGTGPYGIATTPDVQVFFASLAGNYLG